MCTSLPVAGGGSPGRDCAVYAPIWRDEKCRRPYTATQGTQRRRDRQLRNRKRARANQDIKPPASLSILRPSPLISFRHPFLLPRPSGADHRHCLAPQPLCGAHSTTFVCFFSAVVASPSLALHASRCSSLRRPFSTVTPCETPHHARLSEKSPAKLLQHQ